MHLLTRQRPTREQVAKREAHLIERARAGDAQAFDVLVRLHFARVYSLLFRLLGNHEDAEDIAQDCFVKAQRSLGWYRAEASFSTWLYRIAISLSRDHYRDLRRSVGALEVPTEVADPTQHGAGPQEAAARRELSRALQVSLDRLPHRLRAALVMRTHEALEYEEIARVLGITPQTARAHVMQARRLLERWLQPWTDRGGAS